MSDKKDSEAKKMYDDALEVRSRLILYFWLETLFIRMFQAKVL